MTAVRTTVIALFVTSCGLAGAEQPVVVTLEKTDGTTLSGTLAEISPTAVRLGDAEPVAVATVRRLTAAGTDGGGGGVLVEGVDGSRLAGDDFAWDAGAATVATAGGRVELPVQRVRSVRLRPPRPAGDGEPTDWRTVLPESPETDLLVVGKPDEAAERLEVVECAIAAVTADAVTIVLEEERIPVKRAKVVGLWFLRPDAAAGGTRVEIDGGSLAANTVSWTADGLVVDEVVRMPATMLRSIDYAAGRTVQLRTLRPERSETEPFFGAVGGLEELRPYFAPRFVGPGAGTLVLRPRSRVVWRVPADARRFRAAVACEPGQPAPGDVLSVLLDDREVFRRSIDEPAATPIDVDVSGGRRLVIVVDFPAAAGLGGPLRLTTPVFEK